MVEGSICHPGVSRRGDGGRVGVGTRRPPSPESRGARTSDGPLVPGPPEPTALVGPPPGAGHGLEEPSTHIGPVPPPPPTQGQGRGYRWRTENPPNVCRPWRDPSVRLRGTDEEGSLGGDGTPVYPKTETPDPVVYRRPPSRDFPGPGVCDTTPRVTEDLQQNGSGGKEKEEEDPIDRWLPPGSRSQSHSRRGLEPGWVGVSAEAGPPSRLGEEGGPTPMVVVTATVERGPRVAGTAGIHPGPYRPRQVE